MDKICASFYLRQYRIRIFRQAIAAIGNPKFIRFMVKEDGSSLILQPYDQKTFQSIRIQETTGYDSWSTEISSKPLCLLLATRLGWDLSRSYRVPGKVYTQHPFVLLDLSKSYPIKRRENNCK